MSAAMFTSPCSMITTGIGDLGMYSASQANSAFYAQWDKNEYWTTGSNRVLCLEQ